MEVQELGRRAWVVIGTPGKTVELKPGGYHVMLMALKAPLKEGDAVPVTLTFKDKDGRESAVVINAPVRSLTAAPATAPAHGKH